MASDQRFDSTALIDSLTSAKPMHPQSAGAPRSLSDCFDGPLIESSGVRLSAIEALQLSLRLDLTRLFNVRNAMSIDQFLSDAPSARDFGLPDTLGLSLQSATDLHRLQQVIARAIALYEPRLLQVAVKVAPDAARPALARAVISASALLGSQRIQFHLKLDFTIDPRPSMRHA